MHVFAPYRPSDVSEKENRSYHTESRPATRDPRPATRDPRLLVKLVITPSVTSESTGR